jgi:putative membrane protein
MGFAVLGCSVLVTASSAMAQSADMDKQFLTTASQSDYTEIKFSQLAADKATNPRVKQFAQKMVDDHTKLEADMKPFAEKMGVTPVMELDSEHQTKFDALSQLSGMEFDKTYMQAMNEDHHKALTLFQQEEKSAGDPGLKAAVAKGEKVVAAHTKMADMAVSRMGKMGSAAPSM